MISAPTTTRWLSTGQAGKSCDPPVSAQTIYSWIKNGVHTPLGVVKLKAKKQGGRYFILPESLEEFNAAINDALNLSPVSETPAAMARRDRKGMEEARKALRRS